MKTKDGPADEGDVRWWVDQVDEPQFNSSGYFTAWAIGTMYKPDRGYAGVSCACWYVTKHANSELPVRYARASEAPESDEKRAAVAAVYRSLQALPKRANVIIYVREPHVVKGLRGAMRNWEARSFKRHEGGVQNGWEIWQGIIKICDEKNLKVEVKKDNKAEATFARLRKWGSVVARRRAAVIGFKKGDKVPYRKGQ